MQHDCLALATDLMLWSVTSDVADRGEYLVIATEKAPGWYAGNLLVFPGPPSLGDFSRWNQLFEREFGHRPDILHRLFYWPGGVGDRDAMAPFDAAGFEMEEGLTLAAHDVCAPRHVNMEVTMREIEGDHDWDLVFALQFSCRPERFEPEGFARFLRRRIGDYRRTIELGMGAWFGAFIGQRLVGTLGMFHRDGLGRFQEVMTDPDYRRRGVCGTLVHHVARIGLQRWGCRQLAMVADPHDHAARIYESLGFRPTEHTSWLFLYP